MVQFSKIENPIIEYEEVLKKQSKHKNDCLSTTHLWISLLIKEKNIMVIRKKLFSPVPPLPPKAHSWALSAEQWECENVYLCEGKKMSGWVCGRTNKKVVEWVPGHWACVGGGWTTESAGSRRAGACGWWVGGRRTQHKATLHVNVSRKYSTGLYKRALENI